MQQIFQLPYQLILQTLLFFYNVLFNNFGLAIIALTILIRSLLLPLTLPTIKAQKKMADLKPHLDRIKEEHAGDKRKQQEEQLKLFQEHGVNPLAGCLPTIVQIFILIVLYNVFISYLGPDAKINGNAVNTNFLWWNLSKPDPLYVLPVLAGVTQFLMSKMITPPAPAVRKDDTKPEKKEKEDFASTMQEVQNQMVYTMPVMTTLISLTFPSGLSLYWVVGNIYSIIQQYFISGWGGLKTLFKRSSK